jgi:hypothetical protein
MDFVLSKKPQKPIKFFSVLIFVFFFCEIASAHAATLYFSTGQGYAVGQTFPVAVIVSTPNSEAVNAVSANITFDSGQLELVSISQIGSMINMWASPPTFSNQTGSADLEGIMLNPGFTGKNGNVATLNFKVLSAGSTVLSFSQASVLADDGMGTNVLTSAPPKSISLGIGTAPNATTDNLVPPGAPSAPVITSATNPDPTKWYNNSNPSFSWAVPPDVTGIRLQYDLAPIATPSVVYNPVISSKTLNNIPDGTYYFHAQFENKNGWGAIAHFKFSIDTTPPNPFSITVQYPAISDPDQRPRLYFKTTDSGSGVDRYNIKIGDSDFASTSAADVSDPYIVSNHTPGTATVIVDVYDMAGNKATASSDVVIPAIDPPTIDCSSNQIAEGSPVKILGTSLPGSTVTISLTGTFGAVVSNTAVAGDDGRFGLIWSSKLGQDIYTLKAKAVSSYGILSREVKICTIAVGSTFTSKLVSLILNYLSLILIILIALALVTAVAIYAFHKLRAFGRKMRSSIIETEKDIHVDFARLEKDLSRHVDLLESAQGKRQLTKEEKTILKSFKEYLDRAEKDIDTKLDKLKKAS